MTRAREPADWDRDLAAARSVERRVHDALLKHGEISHLADLTHEMDVLDFRFRFEREDVHLDAKAKFQRYSDDIAEQWPDVPRDELFILDETSFRELLWQEGCGYLIVDDQPRGRWHVYGPWELCLGPRRRFERRGNRSGVEFLKGKLLLDFRTASRTTAALDVDAVLDVVRRSRAALRTVRAITVRTESELPVLPRRPARPAPNPTRETVPSPEAERRLTVARSDNTSDGWAGLSDDLARTVRAKWGWSHPTPVQQAAFPSILQGRNVLVIAPTAGGKTEAALLPLLDLHRLHGWGAGRPSIVALSPLKALLDDQFERWRRATALVGATAFAWHGDVSQDAKNAFKDNPADALLITPESLELLLTSPSHDERVLFGGLRAVVIDEIHAFVGTPRGAQVASLLERLFRFVDADFQRVGLSATLGAPDRALDWLQGGSLREKAVARGASRMQGEDVSVRTYEADHELVAVVRDSISEHRALVFTGSRRRAEHLAHLLGVPVHHSSVSAEDRDEAVRSLRAGERNCIVATTSLEMGIDIGDLDLVVHDGAPSSPSSYLQRRGRAGRKTGERRMVFTVGERDDLILLLGVLARVRRDELEQVDPRRGARLVLAQQAVAITMQDFIADRAALYETLRWSPTFAGLDADIEATIDHLLATRVLATDGERLVLGPEGNRRFVGRNIGELLATFDGRVGATIVDETGRRIGTVDWDQIQSSSGTDRTAGLVLSGRAWTIARIDRSDGTVTVHPASSGKPPSWRGPMIDVDRPTWEAVREVLASTEVPIDLDERARGWLTEERARWAARLASPVRAVGSHTVVDSFCGVQVHRGVLAALGLDGRAEGATCEIACPLPELAAKAREVLGDFEALLDGEAARVAPQIHARHRDLVAPSVLLAEARRFHVDSHGIHRFLTLLSES